jgi:deoxycytidine triphosphate deaminase
VLSDIDIAAAITRGEFQIAYSFLPDGDGRFVRQQRSMRTDRDQAAEEFLRDHSIRSRIALTLGPLVKLVSHDTRGKRSQRFAGHSGVIDLRSCRGGWLLMPSQSVVVFTNEQVKLCPALVGLIIGRVSSYNNGLVTATSYLDSGWEGLVKLHLINTSRRPVRLQLGMEIGRLLLFSTPTGSLDASEVSKQSVHYGFTWPRILDDEIDPFPQAFAPRIVRVRAGLIQANDFLQRYAGIGLLALAISLGLGAVNVYGKITSALELEKQVRTLDSTVTALHSSVPISGTVSIRIPRGTGEGVERVKLPSAVAYKGASSVVWTNPRTRGVVTTTAIANDPDGNLVVAITAAMPNAAKGDTLVNVDWLYVP